MPRALGFPANEWGELGFIGSLPTCILAEKNSFQTKPYNKATFQPKVAIVSWAVINKWKMSGISRKRKRTSPSLKPSPSPPAVFPDVMLGTYRMKDDKIIKKIINKCLPVCGGLDTATIYGNQPSIGRAIASEGLLGGGRDGVPTPWVQTKLWRSVKPEDVVKTIKKDLKDLQIERLDCWLMHW